MALVTKFGVLVIGVKRNANADMKDIKSAHKPKFVTDRSREKRREDRKLEKLEERMLMRKQIKKYVGI